MRGAQEEVVMRSPILEDGVIRKKRCRRTRCRAEAGLQHEEITRHIYMYTYIYIYISLPLSIYIYTSVQHGYTYIHVYIYIYTHIMYVYIYISICVCIRAWFLSGFHCSSLWRVMLAGQPLTPLDRAPACRRCSWASRPRQPPLKGPLKGDIGPLQGYIRLFQRGSNLDLQSASKSWNMDVG